MVDTPFKVIVVGGGPAGLIAAHALSRASIDFVVLESRSAVVVDVGASLVLFPQNLRVLAQLGLLERVQNIGTEMLHVVSMTLESHIFKESWASETMRKNHGTPATMFHRAQLLQTLFDGLDVADQSRILTNKRVIDIKSDASGVEAICGDGSVYHGSIIIGADGVHSRVRQAMRELTLASSSSKADTNDEKPFTSTYKAMWFPFPRQPNFAPGDVFESHGTNISTQLLNGNKDSWVFIYEKLKTPTKERVSYSDNNVIEMANRWGDLYLGPNLKVKDVFSQRYTAGMSNLEEGVAKYWSWDKIVLVGDACHKFTPNQALGFNNGVQDVISLVNELHKSLVAKGKSSLDAISLATVFDKYQASRMQLAEKDHNISAGVTRMTSWDSWLYWLLDRYILSSIPGFDDFMVTRVMAGPISKSFVLEFVQADEPYQGKIPWEHIMISPGTDAGP